LNGTRMKNWKLAAVDKQQMCLAWPTFVG